MITNDGDKAENLVGKLIKRCKRNRRGDPRGDFTFTGLKEKDEFFEVKKNSLNQVRPCKWIPIILVDENDNNQLYFIPPKDLYEVTKSRSRGQHSENPLENVNLGCSKTFLQAFRISKKELNTRVETYFSSIDFSSLSKIRAVFTQMIEETQTLRNRTQDMLEELCNDEFAA